jgi:hypothetical protein
MGWGFRWRALKWLFCSGRVAFYFRNAGSLKTERWLFSSGLCKGLCVEREWRSLSGKKVRYGPFVVEDPRV